MSLVDRIKKLEARHFVESLIPIPIHYHEVHGDEDAWAKNADCKLCQAMNDEEYRQWCEAKTDGIKLVIIR